MNDLSETFFERMGVTLVTRWSSFLCSAACTLLVSTTSWAGRPLDTEDAATAEPHTCQIEAWRDRQGHTRTAQGAVACGVVAGLELGWGQSRVWDQASRADGLIAQGLTMKWVPAFWRMPATLGLAGGELQGGLKAELIRSASEGSSAVALQALASWRMDAAWSMHANVGVQQLSHLHRTAAQVRLAAVWAPHPQTLLFAEAAASQHPQWFGGRTLSIGGRWWALADQLGFDLKATQEAHVPSTRWSLGLGWYGWGGWGGW